MVNAARHTTLRAPKAPIVLGCTAACVLLCVVAAGQRRRLAKLEKEVRRQEALRNGEHAGRVKAEKVTIGRLVSSFKLRTLF